MGSGPMGNLAWLSPDLLTIWDDANASMEAESLWPSPMIMSCGIGESKPW